MFERERYTGCIYDTAPRFFIVFYSLKFWKDVVLFSGGKEEIMGTLFTEHIVVLWLLFVRVLVMCVRYGWTNSEGTLDDLFVVWFDTVLFCLLLLLTNGHGQPFNWILRYCKCSRRATFRAPLPFSQSHWEGFSAKSTTSSRWRSTKRGIMRLAEKQPRAYFRVAISQLPQSCKAWRLLTCRCAWGLITGPTSLNGHLHRTGIRSEPDCNCGLVMVTFLCDCLVYCMQRLDSFKAIASLLKLARTFRRLR